MMLLNGCRSNSYHLINLGHLIIFKMRGKQILSCLCEREMLNSLRTVSLQPILALCWHLLLTVLLFDVIFGGYSQWSAVQIHSMFVFLLHRHRKQWPVAFATWITVAEKKEESGECECGRSMGFPFPLGSLLHPVYTARNSLRPVSISHTMLFTLLSLLMIQTDKSVLWALMSCKNCVVLVLVSMCFSYKNGSTRFPTGNHSRAGEMAKQMKLNNQSSILGTEGERRESIPGVNLWRLHVLALPIETSKQKRGHNSFRDNVDCAMSFKIFLSKIY